jgi:hypothetical protein
MRKTIEEPAGEEPDEAPRPVQRRAPALGRRAYDGEPRDNTKLYVAVGSIIASIFGANGIVDFRAAERGEKVTQANNDMLKENREIVSRIMAIEQRADPIYQKMDRMADACLASKKKSKPVVIEEEPDGE